ENLSLVPGKLRETLATHRAKALLSRELATVSTRVPIEADLESLRRAEPDWPRLRALWTELEFSSLLRQLPAPTGPVLTVEPAPLLEGAAALAEYLAKIAPDGPLAVEWVGHGGPPEPAGTVLGLYHPDAGPVQLQLAESVPDFGGRLLIGHDAKHLVEWHLAKNGQPPAL